MIKGISMTIIDMIRHAESDTTVHDDFSRPFTQKGYRQSQQIAYNLRQIPYSTIFSSPFKRAVDTVVPIARDHGLPIQTDDRLVERKMPSWVSDFSEYVAHQWRDLTFFKSPGESIFQVQKRYLSFLYSLPATSFGAIGSHGTAISSVIESAMPGKGGDFFKTLSYAAVTRLEVSDHQIVRIASWSENFKAFISLE